MEGARGVARVCMKWSCSPPRPVSPGPERGPYPPEDAATAHLCSTVLPKLLHILPIFLYLPHPFPTPALGSSVFLPPVDNGVSREQVLGKVKYPWHSQAAHASPKQTVSRQPATELCFPGSRSFCSCTQDALQDQHLSAVALPDLARVGCGCLLQLALGHLSSPLPALTP